MKFAKIAKEQNKSISCYKFTHKYSLIYYRDGNEPIVYGGDFDIDDLKRELGKQNNFVIIKKKQIDDDVKKLDYKIVEEGRRYILIEGNK